MNSLLNTHDMGQEAVGRAPFITRSCFPAAAAAVKLHGYYTSNNDSLRALFLDVNAFEFIW